MHDHHWDLDANATWIGQTVTKHTKKLGNCGGAQRCPFLFSIFIYDLFVLCTSGWVFGRVKKVRSAGEILWPSATWTGLGAHPHWDVTENLGLALKHIESISIILRDPLQQSDPGQHGEGPAGMCNANQRWQFGQRKEKKHNNVQKHVV